MKRSIDGYYDPNPNPVKFVVWAIIGLISVFLWTNPGAINNIMLMLNPQLAKLREEEIRAQRETIRYILLIISVICGVVILVYIWEKRRR